MTSVVDPSEAPPVTLTIMNSETGNFCGTEEEEEKILEETSKVLKNASTSSSPVIIKNHDNNNQVAEISREQVVGEVLEEAIFQFPQQPAPVIQLDHVEEAVSSSTTAADAGDDDDDEEEEAVVVQVEPTVPAVAEAGVAVGAQAEPQQEQESGAMQASSTASVNSNDHCKNHSVNGNNNGNLELESIVNGMDNNPIYWRDGIGHLPGSDLKFRLNEFGLVEILDDEACQRVYNQTESNQTVPATVAVNNMETLTAMSNGTNSGNTSDSSHDMEVNTAMSEKRAEVNNDAQIDGLTAVTSENEDTATIPIVKSASAVLAEEKQTAIHGHTSLQNNAVDSESRPETVEKPDISGAEEPSERASATVPGVIDRPAQCEIPQLAEMETQRIDVSQLAVDPEPKNNCAEETLVVEEKLVSTKSTDSAAKDQKPADHQDHRKTVHENGASVFGANRNSAHDDPAPSAEVKEDIKVECAESGSSAEMPKLEMTNPLHDRKHVQSEQSDGDHTSTSNTESESLPTKENGKQRSISISSEEIPEIDKVGSTVDEAQNGSRTPSPVFHLPPPPPSASYATSSNGLEGIPVLKAENEAPEDSKELVFCKCCGCFGLQEEFYQSTFCTKACGDSYKYHTLSPDGRFRRPMPVTPKKCKILPGFDTGSSDSSSDGKNSGDRNSASPLDKNKKKKQKSPPVSKAKVKTKMKAGKGADETEVVSKSKNPRRLSTTKSSSNPSKDGKKRLPETLSKRLPTSPERKLIPESLTKEVQLSPDITQVRTKHFPVTRTIPASSDFDWKKYLAETSSKSAPHRLFRQPALPPKNPFEVGMMLESIDPQHQSLICVTTVVETQGYRIRLRFQGFSEAYDYWVNADSLDIFPAGWCEENNLELQPPPDAPEPFNWHQYLVENQLQAAPRHIFAITKEDFTVDSGVRPGMKLEAVDIRNQNLVCVATVAKVMGERILVHFDSWDSLYDYWTDLTSPYIHPVGWCDKNGVKLTPPNYVKAAFSWEQYLKETNSIPMPARLFRPLPPVGFKKGFKIECVDKRNPFLVRVATIAEVEKHNLVIHFDNWPSNYDYSVYELSPDIHPVGWCTHTGHPLQPPPPADGTWKGSCTIFGCLGLGHIKGPKFLTHNSEKNCPYAPQNYKKDWVPADRVIVFERNYGLGLGQADRSGAALLPTKLVETKPTALAPQVQSKVSTKGAQSTSVKSSLTPKSATVKRKRSSTSSNKEYGVKKPKTQPRVSTSTPSPPSSAVLTEQTTENEVESKPKVKEEPPDDESASTKSVTDIPSRMSLDGSEETNKPMVQESTVEVKKELEERPSTSKAAKAAKEKDKERTRLSAPSLSAFPPGSSSSSEPEAEFPPNYAISSVPLKTIVGDLTEATVSSWKVEELAGLIAKIRGCEHIANLFLEQLIDGESFLMLSQTDFVNVMGLKLGPAIKLTNVIKLIKFNSVSANFKAS